MEMLRARFGEQLGLRRRIITVDGGTVHIAFGQAHDFAAFEVDSREYDHGFHSRKRFSKSNP